MRKLLTGIENPVTEIDEGIVEGGDLILDRDILYIGMGEQTEPKGVRWLEDHLRDRLEVQPLQLKSGFLHLDVVFNLVGRNVGLIYPLPLRRPLLRCRKWRVK